MTDTPTRFAVGQPIVMREVIPRVFGGVPDHAGFTYAAVVVVDGSDAIVTYQPVGGPLFRRTGSRAGPRGRNIPSGGWDGGYAADLWQGDAVIRVHRPTEPWSTWRWVRNGQWRPGFYLNLETPWRRTGIGFDYHDWELDVLVHQAGTLLVTDLKDEDEFEWCAAEGGFPPEAVARTRAAAIAARDVAQRGAWPFDVDWTPWLPNPDWPIPTLPEEWQRLS